MIARMNSHPGISASRRGHPSRLPGSQSEGRQREFVRSARDQVELANDRSSRADEITKILRSRCQELSNPEWLGCENHLAAQFGVGKRTLRLAVRELEREGIVQVQRGRGGGIFSVRKPIGRASQLLSDQLALAGLPIRDVRAAANLFLRLGSTLACKSDFNNRNAYLDKATEIFNSRQTGDHHRDVDAWNAMRSAICEASGNPVVVFFHDAFQSAFRDVLAADLRIGTRADVEGRLILSLEGEIIEAIRNRSISKVKNIMKVLDDSQRYFLNSSLLSKNISSTLRPKFLFPPPSYVRKTDGKLAHQTLRALQVHIIHSNFDGNERLGTLRELAEILGVGADVMRETIQLGCEQNLIWMKRGRGGGIFVHGAGYGIEVQDEIASLVTESCKISDLFLIKRLNINVLKLNSAYKISDDIINRSILMYKEKFGADYD